MIIDFKEMEKLVPEKGTLNLILRRQQSDGKLIVCYAPKFENNEEKNEFRPVTSVGTADELNVEWNSFIPEISVNLKLLNTSTESTLAKRKEESAKDLLKSKSKNTSKPNAKTAETNTLFSKNKGKTDAKAATETNTAEKEITDDGENAVIDESSETISCEGETSGEASQGADEAENGTTPDATSSCETQSPAESPKEVADTTEAEAAISSFF